VSGGLLRVKNNSARAALDARADKTEQRVTASRRCGVSKRPPLVELMAEQPKTLAAEFSAIGFRWRKKKLRRQKEERKVEGKKEKLRKAFFRSLQDRHKYCGELVTFIPQRLKFSLVFGCRGRDKPRKVSDFTFLWRVKSGAEPAFSLAVNGYSLSVIQEADRSVRIFWQFISVFG
jgi:hypothetical protein